MSFKFTQQGGSDRDGIGGFGLHGNQQCWGDEFFATVIEAGRLRFKQMGGTQKYENLQLLLSGPFEAEGKASQLIDRHGGGWEVVAG